MTRVLVVGDMRLGTNSRSLADAFIIAGHELWMVDTSRASTAPKGSRLWWEIRQRGAVTRTENLRLAAELDGAIRQFAPEILIAIKTVIYDQEMLLSAQVPYKIHLSFDDVSNSANTSTAYLAAESKWNLIVTTKAHNVAEIKQRSGADVEFMFAAYDPAYHVKTTASLERRYLVGFIGVARPDRADLPRELGRRFPGQSVVYGPRWRRLYPVAPRGLDLGPNAVYGSFTKAANSMRIGIVLLNSENRDTHTNRSFEVPATGQLPLVRDTDEHRQIYGPNSAVYFENLEQMYELITELKHKPREVERIARNAHRVITDGQHTYESRVRQILERVKREGL